MKYELKHWAGRGNYCIGSTVERVYVNIPGSRESVGYIERRCVVAGRKGDTYYEQHRISKGDAGETVSDVVTVNCGELSEALANLLSEGRTDHLRDTKIWERAREIAIGTQATKAEKFLEI